MCKYLDDMGFNVFAFGTLPDGTVEVCNGDGDVVVSGVTKEQQVAISEYLTMLLERVEDHIDVFYGE